MAPRTVSTALDVAKNVLLLFIGTVMTLSIGVVREISADVTAIKILVARAEESGAEVKRRTDRLEAKVFGGGQR